MSLVHVADLNSSGCVHDGMSDQFDFSKIRTPVLERSVLFAYVPLPAFEISSCICTSHSHGLAADRAITF